MNAKEPRWPFGPCVLTVVAIFLSASSSAMAQTATGRIIGTASDAQGAAIAGAKTTVTNTGTNESWNTVTNSEGFRQVLELPVGNYSIAAEQDGFSRVVTALQSLAINQALRIDDSSSAWKPSTSSITPNFGHPRLPLLPRELSARVPGPTIPESFSWR